MLYALVVGLAAGWLLRGRPEGLTQVQFRWAPFALAGLAIQVALFSGPVADRIGDLGAPIYVASSAAVLVVVLRNLAMPGLPVVALGAASNLVAIVANGGWMPAGAAALAAVGATIGPGYSNSRAFPSPALEPLTDVFAMPAWLPLTNVFSIGDVLIGAGVAIAVVAAMRRAPMAADRPERH
jgi:hypothetical protein